MKDEDVHIWKRDLEKNKRIWGKVSGWNLLLKTECYKHTCINLKKKILYETWELFKFKIQKKVQDLVTTG